MAQLRTRIFQPDHLESLENDTGLAAEVELGTELVPYFSRRPEARVTVSPVIDGPVALSLRERMVEWRIRERNDLYVRGLHDQARGSGRVDGDSAITHFREWFARHLILQEQRTGRGLLTDLDRIEQALPQRPRKRELDDRELLVHPTTQPGRDPKKDAV